MKFKQNKVHLLLLSGLAMGVSTPVVSAAQIEEIVVTAQKRSENLQEVPISINAFAGDSLEKLGVNTQLSLAELTPGLTFNYIGGSAKPYIRGVGSNSVGAGNELAVATYVDGVYLSTPGAASHLEFFDIERVEVLKGPQGTLFGRNATGGAINVITRKPTAETEGQLEATYSRFDSMVLKGYLSGALNEDAGLFGSIAAITKDSDGFYKNVNPANGLSDEDIGDSESDAIRAKLLWEPSDELSITVALDKSDSESGGSLAWQPVTGDLLLAEALGGSTSRVPYEYSGDVDPKIVQEDEGVTLTIEYAAPFADIKYIGASRDSLNATQTDADASNLPVLSFFVNTETETTTHELQFTSNSDGPLQWVTGAFYYDDRQVNEGGDYPGLGTDFGQLIFFGTPAPVTPAELGFLSGFGSFVAITQSGRTSESYAFFGEGSYEFNESTKLTLGARYTKEELETTPILSGAVVPNATLDGFNVFSGPTFTAEEDFSDTSYTAILNHYFTDDVMGYASYKSGFKSGVFNSGSTVTTEPEYIDAFELGFKSTVLDGSMRFNGAAFYYDYDDLQLPFLDDTGTVVTRNAAAAEILGAEFNVDWAASDNLLVAFNVSLLDAKFKDYPNAATVTASPFGGTIEGTANLDDADLPRAPDFSTNLSLSYTIPMGDAGNVSLDANLFITDDVLLRNAQDIVIDGYEMVSASATWTSASEQFYVKIWGNNLTDEEIISNGTGIPTGFIGSYLDPITYGITAGMKFGL